MYYLYRFLNKKDDIIYVGKTGDILQRLNYHFGTRGHLPKQCYNDTNRIEILKLKTKTEMNIKELYYISKYKPHYNSADKNEEFLLPELEINDSWEYYDLQKEDNNNDKIKICKLEKKIEDLKEQLIKQKEYHNKHIKDTYAELNKCWEYETIIQAYEEKTGLKWCNGKLKIMRVS